MNSPAFARSPLRRALPASVLFLMCAGVAFVAFPAPATDAIILTDGFLIQGRSLKENNPFGYGFDVVDDGPKIVVFSMHSRKGAKVDKDIVRPEFTAYKRPFPGSRGFRPPGLGEIKAEEFDEKWRRVLKVKHPEGNYHEVQQLITFLDPYTCYVASTSHNWRLAYHTSEMEPKEVRKLLGNHPELKDPPGKPDPMRRLAIATFMKDVNWLTEARDEIEQAKKDIPGEWPKDATERREKLRTEIDIAETKLVLDELEAMLSAGRYKTAQELLARFTPRESDAKETTRLAVLKAQLETVQPKYDDARRLLRDLIDRESGGIVQSAHLSAAGTMAYTVVPRPKPDPAVAPLIPAAETVLRELHPDSTDRIELFLNLAKQADQRMKEGKDPGAKSLDLLSLAITGWLKGKNGADPSADAAARAWATREMAQAYLCEDGQNVRTGLLDAYLIKKPLPPDELAQVISLLPPPFPEDLSKPLGPEVPLADAGVRGVFRRQAGSTADPNGPVDYLLRLPPEYHHGRSYPVILALSHPSVPPEKLVAGLARYADRLGYIVAAPVWSNLFSEPYDWTGKQHAMVTTVLRDLLRRFQVDSDKVFLLGFGEGANFAMDMGCSHPDLFAGVVLMGPTPNNDLMMHYWANAQKLPVYVVTGEQAGSSAPNLRKVFEKWMPRGFPALMTQYKGRGVEWYGTEVPRLFDWMGRKTRARGTSSLKLNAATFEPWNIGRETETRFYWVGTTEVQRRHLISNTGFGKGWVPASIYADLRQGNEVVLKTLGLKTVVVWLERDMIDWSKPVRVTLNGQNPMKYVPKVMQPDLALMFEEIHRSGDRKMLFLGRLEFATP